MAQSDILVRFGADVDPLKKGAKQASLSLDGVRDNINAAGKAMAAMTAAAGAMGAAMVKAGIESATEIENLSSLAGLGVKEFHKYSLAVRSVGIEQDKFADILKDTNDKIGDFIQTGGGPMADFFENIAPKIGVTVDQFKKLNSREALQLYVDSLEKANVSQQEMTFYMEAIASDSSALLPLLQNSGETMNAYAENAEKLGYALSEVDAQKIKEASIALDQGKQASTAFTQQLAVQFAPVLTGITDLIRDQAGEYGGVQKAAEKAFKFTIQAAGFVGDSIRGIQVVIKGLEMAFWGFSVVVNRVLQAIPESVDFVMNSAKSSINGLIDGMNKLPGVDIGKMVYGESAVTQALKEATQTAKNNLALASAEMHEILMKPLPSDSLDEFVAKAQEAAQKSAEAAAKVKEDNLGLTIPSLDEDPEVMAEKEKQAAMLASYNEYAAARLSAGEDLGKTELQKYNEFAEAQKDLERKAMQDKLGTVSSAFSAIAGLMDSENKRLFEIGKVAAISSAVVDGISAAISSYAAGAKIGGPFVGAAYAAASVAATAGQISGLMSTSYGGSGSTSASTVTATPVIQEASAETAVSSSANKSITLEGFDPSLMYSGEQLTGLMDAMRQAQRDGYDLVVA